MAMGQGTRMYDVVLMTLLLYSVFIYTESSGTTPCSWGSWLPWDCSCCGGSRDKTVYRVRAQCCLKSSTCDTLRVDAIRIPSTGTDYQQDGKCITNCPHEFGGQMKRCIPEMPTPGEIPRPNKTKSCMSVCIDITTTTASTIATIPHQPNITKSTVPVPTTDFISSSAVLTASNATTTATTPHQPNINKSTAPAPTTDFISSSAVLTTTNGNTDIPTTTNVTNGSSWGNSTGGNDSPARVTANCHLVLGIGLAVIAVLILF